ncbi:restriction endonuclease subunit S, partial [Oceanospirillum sp. HFRX-1_2]
SARLLYQEWFVHLRFPGHEQVKITDGVPEGWEKKPLKQIATLNYGKALKADVRVPGPFPVYGSSGEVGSHEKALVKGPGIVVGRKGNVGSAYWVNTDFYPIDTVYFISAEESSLFLYHALQNVQFINTDVAVPGLNRDMAYSREILVPDDKNYQRFLSEVVPIQEQINKLQDYNIKLAQARDLLLPKLMSGELTV